MRIRTKRPDRLVLIHQDWVSAVVLCIVFLILLGVAKAFFDASSYGEGIVFSVYALLCVRILFFALRRYHFDFDKNLNRITITYWDFGLFAGRQQYRLSDLYSVRDDRGQIILKMNKSVNLPPSIARGSGPWAWLNFLSFSGPPPPLQINELSLFNGYYSTFIREEVYAKAIRDWAGVGRL